MSAPRPRTPEGGQPVVGDRPALVDTSVWTWARDRRFPRLAPWFNAEVRSGRVLVCDLVVLQLVRLASNEPRAVELAARLSAIAGVPAPRDLRWRAREVQLLLAEDGAHRRVPPGDLVIAVTAGAANVPLLRYDRDYERLAAVTRLDERCFVPPGTRVP